MKRVIDFFMAILFLIGIVGLIGNGIQHFFPTSKKAAPTLEDRIHELTQSLNNSVTTIQEIENEITKREGLVSKLQQDADTASKLATVNKDQVDAIAQLLRVQIQTQERNSFWFNQAINTLYMLLGVAIAELVRWFMRWRARRKLRASAV